jgi:cytidylate kinase
VRFLSAIGAGACTKGACAVLFLAPRIALRTARSGCATKMPTLTIAIDGPAGSGKSSLAKRVAQILGYLYLDSGAMYRALALKALREKVALDNSLALEDLARGTHIELKPPTPEQEAAGSKNRVFLDTEEVTQAIRTAEVAQAASRLATTAGVREFLVAEQQRAGAGGGVVMEGRDIGTVVFPRAELKIFLEASPEVRAGRRWKEHQEKGEVMTPAQVLDEVRERDRRDRERKVSPLVRASDAVLVDNTAMDVEETARLVVMLAREREKELSTAAGREL